MAATAHHLWPAPALRQHRGFGGAAAAAAAAEGPSIRFDAFKFDLVGAMPEEIADAILQFELPQLCHLSPHSDKAVDDWLRQWVDGEEVGLPALEARIVFGLRELADERPEVCPLLRAQLWRFEQGLRAYLSSWPPSEPARSPSQGSGRQVLDLELELHGILSIVDRTPFGSHLFGEVGQSFCQVAMGWIFKLESVYGLPVVEQPERLARLAPSAPWLSMLSWPAGRLVELLRCPFFRPTEAHLLELAQYWCEARACGRSVGAEEIDPAPSDAPPGASGDDGTIDGVNRDEIQALMEDALLWELLEDEKDGAADGDAPLSLGGGVDPVPEDMSPSSRRDTANLVDDVLVEEEVSADASMSIRSAACQISGAESLSSQSMTLIPGCTFELVPRGRDCPFAAYNELAAFACSLGPGGSSLRCRNSAREEQVIGSSRQMLASSVPLCAFLGGRHRFDFRLLAGTEAEAAHLLEVGLLVSPAVSSGVHFSGTTATRPSRNGCEDLPCGGPFCPFLGLADAVLEGVRLSIEVDFGEELVHMRYIPPVPGVEQPPAGAGASLRPWLQRRASAEAMRSRPAGELDCSLFREHAEHLCDLIQRGRLESDLVDAVLADDGAVVAALGGIAAVGAEKPRKEQYHFYVVVPAGVELEIF